MADNATPVATGRFAPSPTGPLHVGNLRTAVLAWLFARSAGSGFVVRVEDLDRVASRDELVRVHLADLRALGLDWDGPVVRQSDRFALYEAALDRLERSGDLYPCYCTRKEVAEAVRAPHGPLPEGAYPGTCAALTAAERAAREASGRRAALRVRAGGARVEVTDRLAGRSAAHVDDFVVRRNDGVPAYQLAVVVDDADQGIEEVVRGDDLLPTTHRQVWLAGRLGLSVPAYVHVPLVYGPDGDRLAKRHGAVTLADLGGSAAVPSLLGAIARSLGVAAGPGPTSSAAALLTPFRDLLADPDGLATLRSSSWTFDPGSPAPTAPVDST
jgi:glutamyl-tRNA synthetase